MAFISTHRFDSRDDLALTETGLPHCHFLHHTHSMMAEVSTYDLASEMVSLRGQRAPIQALRDWQESYPQLFIRQVRNHAGPDTRVGLTNGPLLLGEITGSENH